MDSKIKKLILTITFIITATIFLKYDIKAESLNIEEPNANNLEEAELYNEDDSSNLYITAINTSSEIVKQQNDNPYEDKPYSDEYIEWLNASEEEKAKYGYVIPSKEFIAIHKNIQEGEKVNDEEEQKNTDDINSIEATASGFYKIPNLTVENQKDEGWCWAFTSLKCLQTYLQKNKNVNYNLAEYHLAYMKYKAFGGWDDIFERQGKGSYSSYGEAVYKSGGNFYDFIKYTGVHYPSSCSIKGPIIGSDSENHIYYFNEENKINMQNKSPAVKVKKIVYFSTISKEYSSTKITYKNGNRILNNSEIQAFRNAVKSHIQSKGGLYASTKVDENYFNKATNSLYINNNDIKSNHAVTIIGWDDNYSKYNFKSGNQPKNNGAWIAVNSWGNSWGDNGYFYISYDDALVEKNLSGVTDAELASAKPTINIKYTTNSDNTVTVTITSTDKIDNVKVWKNNKWQNDTDWTASYKNYELATYYTEYTKETILTKTYTENTTEFIQVQDELGNYTQNYSAIKITNLDKKGPTISSVTGYSNAWKNSDITLKVNATDSSGLHEFAYSFDGGSTWQSGNTKKYTATQSGISVVVRDKWGNTSKYSETINLKVDKIKPTIVINAKQGVSGTTWVNPITNEKCFIQLNVSDTGGSGVINGYEYSTDNKTWKSSTTKDSLNSYFNYWFTKNETVYFRIKDNAGNYSNSTKVLINMVDTNAPVISNITQTIDKDKQSVSVKVTATDSQSGIALYSFDGGNTWQKNNMYKFKANQTISANKIQAKDNAGNISKYNKQITTISILNGDVNQDKKIDISDIVVLKRHLIAGNKNLWKLQNNAFKAGDIDNDGKITIKDFLLLKQKVLKST